MREHTKWIMILVAISFVALMVFEWGMDLSGRSGAAAAGGEIGRIDGDPVSNEEFTAVYQSLYNQQQQAQEETISPMQNREIEQAAWDQLVMERLIQREIRRRGLTAREAEVRQAARSAPPPEITGNPIFQTNGQFDLSKYHAFLASPQAPPELLTQLESYYRDVIPRTKLMRQVVAGAYVSESELWRRFQERTESAQVRYVVLDPEVLVPASEVQITDADIKRYYNENKKDFIQPARAGVRYVAISKQLTAADTAAARQRAADLRQRILGGADFAEIASAESSDKGSAARGGDLGLVRRGQMVKPFEDAVFSQPVGQVGEPVQSEFGFHVIQVQSRDADTARVRHVLVPVRVSEAREDELIARADSLDDLGERGSLANAAKAMGLQVQTAALFNEVPTLPGVGEAAEAAEWAIEEAEVGETSEVFENSQAYYMVELVDREEGGQLSLVKATPQIRTILSREKKLAKTREIGRGMIQQIRAGRTIEQVAGASSIQVAEAGPFTRLDFVSGLGQGTPAIGAVFGLKQGEVSDVVTGASGPVIVQLLQKTQASRSEFEAQKEAMRMATLSLIEQERWSEFLDSLKRDADVVDLRAELRRQTLAAERAADAQRRF